MSRRAATIICFIALMLFAVDGQVVPSVITEIQASTFLKGVLLASTFLLFPPASFLAGILADRIGKRRVALLGVTLMGLGWAVCGVGRYLPLWAFGFCVFSIGGGVTEGQTTALIGEINPRRERRMINLSQVFFSVGAVGGPLTLGLMKAQWPELPLTTRFLWVAVPHLPLVFSFLLMRDVPVPEHTAGAPEHKALDLFRNRWLLRMMLAILLYVFVEGATVGWMTIHVHNIWGVSQARAPVFLSVFWAAVGLSRLLVALIPHHVSTRRILAVSVALMLAARLLLFLAPSAGVALVAAGLIGLGMGSVWPTLVSAVAHHFPHRSGAAVGLMIAAGGFGIPLGNLYMGIVARWRGLASLLGRAAGEAPAVRPAMLSLALFTLCMLALILTTPMEADLHKP